MTPVEVAWLAGLFEGEGTLCITARGSWVMAIVMGDLDIIERVAKLTEVGHTAPVSHPAKAARGWSPMWRWRCTRLADTIMLAEIMRPHLGNRRGARVDELIAWDAAGRPFIGRQEARDLSNAGKRRRRAAKTAAGLPRGN